MNEPWRIRPSMLVEDVIAEHAESAAFLWQQREAMARSPRAGLGELQAWDARLEVHLAGLFLAGERGLALCQEVLPLDRPGEAFVLVRCALEVGDEPTERVLTQAHQAASADVQIQRGIVAALCVSTPRAERLLACWEGSRERAVRRIALRTAVARRAIAEAQLSVALHSDEAEERALGLRAAGIFGRRELSGLLTAELADADAQCRYEATRALTLLEAEQSLEPVDPILTARGCRSEEMLTMWARALPLAVALEWHTALARQPHGVRQAILVAAAAGSMDLVPWLLERLHEPEHHRIALDAIATLTGLEVEAAGFEVAPPSGFESGPDDDPDHADVAPDPDESRPWADSACVAVWWHAQRVAYSSQQRYFLGEPLGQASLRAALVRAPQQARAVAAFELMRRAEERSVLFPTRAPARQQQRWLQAAGLLHPGGGSGPYG